MEPNLCNVDPINENLPFGCLVDAEQAESEGRLSSSRSSNNAHLLRRAEGGGGGKGATMILVLESKAGAKRTKDAGRI